jgi:hypothetical protein
MTVIQYLKLLPIKRDLSLIKINRNIKLRFKRASSGQEFRIKYARKDFIDLGAGSVNVAEINDFRSSKFISINLPDFVINEHDGMKLIFEYDWNKK